MLSIIIIIIVIIIINTGLIMYQKFNRVMKVR